MIPRFTPRLSLAVFTALVLSAARLAFADTYTITDLGALPDKPYTSAWQQSINARGIVAVFANSNADDIANATFFGDSSFLWHDGVILPLSGLPDSTDTIAASLNNRGQVVGNSRQLGGYSHAVLWEDGVIQALPELPGDTRSFALQINDRGQAVGFSRNPASVILRSAVIWYKGTVSLLPPLPGGGIYDEGLGINEDGQVVGFSGPDSDHPHATLWDKKSRVTDLGTLGGDWSEALSINGKGQIVGLAATTLGGPDPFSWRKGKMTDLGVLKGDVGGVALSINDRGQIVGVSGTALVNGELSDFYTSHAILWEKGTIINLQTRIRAGSGWRLTQATGINNRGQIVAQGVYNGNLRAVLLTPTDGD